MLNRGGGSHLQRGHGRSGARPAYLTLAVLMLVWVGTASAQPGRVVIECATPLTVTQSVTPPAPPLPPPPLPPPPVVPPITDTSPFAFPDQQPGQETDGSCRYFNLCPNDGGCYTSLPNCRNPLRGSHEFACFTPMGMLYQRTQSIGGFRLYVPRDLPPTKIRLLCAAGAL